MGRRSENYLPRATSSERVPFKEGESWQDRHDRRKETAVSEKSEMETWADEHAVDLQVKNSGHHWVFQRGGQVVEWWPSSGRLVLNKRYKKPRKAHDVDQARVMIGRWLNVSEEVR